VGSDALGYLSKGGSALVRHPRQIEVARMQLASSLFVFEDPARGGSQFEKGKRTDEEEHFSREY